MTPLQSNSVLEMLSALHEGVNMTNRIPYQADWPLMGFEFLFEVRAMIHWLDPHIAMLAFWCLSCAISTTSSTSQLDIISVCAGFIISFPSACPSDYKHVEGPVWHDAAQCSSWLVSECDLDLDSILWVDVLSLCISSCRWHSLGLSFHQCTGMHAPPTARERVSRLRPRDLKTW